MEWAIEARDRYGNAIDTAGIVPDLGDAPLSLSGSTISGTVPGAYTVDALVEGVMDAEVLVVVPGAADSVDLSLSDTSLEVFRDHRRRRCGGRRRIRQPGVGTLVALGRGHRCGARGLRHLLEQRHVLFEGAFTVRVDVDDILFDEVGPLLIDSTGPVLELDQPDRGSWHDGLEGSVEGTVTDAWSGVGSLTVDGDPVSVASDGWFSVERDYDFGTNVIETVAVDGDGNVSTDTRAVLAGDFLEWEDDVQNGFMVHLADGPGGLDTLEVLGEEVVWRSTSPPRLFQTRSSPTKKKPAWTWAFSAPTASPGTRLRCGSTIRASARSTSISIRGRRERSTPP